MTNFSTLLKAIIKNNIFILPKLLGITLLNKKQTESYLRENADTLFHEEEVELLLPEIISLANDKKQVFKKKYITTAASYIWKYQNTAAQAKQLRNGSIMIYGKVLDLGFGNSAIVKDLLKPTNRNTHTTKILIAPWSHYWTGYFDYIFFVVFNICRIKNLLSTDDFANAVICYPLTNQTFEQQILELLGVKKENIIDSRTTANAFDYCVIGNNDSWFYSNKDNILLFKSVIESKIAVGENKRSRIYIQRTGRRKVLNEESLFLLLAKYNIDIIYDTPKSFIEQVHIYRNASFIIGPHGASFTNILWCQPGTQLVELFSNNYMPEYFRYLAQVLDLKYTAYCQGEPVGNEHRHVNDDVELNLLEVEQYLQALLN